MRIGCCLFSCVVIFLSLFTTEISFSWQSAAIISILEIFILLILSPVKNSNRNLDTEDMEYFNIGLRYCQWFFCGLYRNNRIKGWILYYTVYNRVDYGYFFDYFGEITIHKAILSLPKCTSGRKVVRLKNSLNIFRMFDESHYKE